MNTDDDSIAPHERLAPTCRRPAGNSCTGLTSRSWLWLLLLTAISAQQLSWADDSGQAFTLTQPADGRQPLLPEKAATAAVDTLARADFKDEPASLSARHTANWVVDSGDNLGMPFMVVDKAQARVMMFDARGQLIGAASALLGLAVGDDSIPGIGTRKLSTIRPEERTTPAGRFVASLGRNLKGEEILWVDYENAISLHRVVTSNAKERRAQRLASPNLKDKRISYGCINVPVAFFDKVVLPAFNGTNGIVYTLPETRANQSVFSSFYPVE